MILISLWIMAGTTGLEPATSAVTGRRSNQLSYVPTAKSMPCAQPQWDGFCGNCEERDLCSGYLLWQQFQAEPAMNIPQKTRIATRFILAQGSPIRGDHGSRSEPLANCLAEILGL